MGLYSSSTPAPRDVGDETRNTLQAQLDLAPDVFAARSSDEFGDPAYARLELGILQDLAPQYLSLLEGELAPAMQRVQSANDAAQRESDTSALETYGPRIAEAIRATNPEQAALMDRLNADAMSGLDLGSQLTPEEERRASQDARAAYSARGRFRSNQAVTAEVLNRYGLGQQRQNERRQFASGVVGLNAVTSVDPALALFGRPSMPASAAAQPVGQMAGMTNATANYFNPFNPYAADIYNTNYNASAAAGISRANNNAALGGAALSAAKLFFMCVPEGQLVDTPAGTMPIETIQAGSIVMGDDGLPATVLQVHAYSEDPAVERWVPIYLEGGRRFTVCDRHRIDDGREAGELQPGDVVDGAAVVAVSRHNGVRRSFDLITSAPDGGYRISGVRIHTMIPTLAAAAAAALSHP